MHCDPEEADEPEEVDDGEADEEPPRPSGPVEFVAADASREPPNVRPRTRAGNPARFIHANKTRFIATSRTST